MRYFARVISASRDEEWTNEQEASDVVSIMLTWTAEQGVSVKLLDANLAGKGRSVAGDGVPFVLSVRATNEA